MSPNICMVCGAMFKLMDSSVEDEASMFSMIVLSLSNWVRERGRGQMFSVIFLSLSNWVRGKRAGPACSQ